MELALTRTKILGSSHFLISLLNWFGIGMTFVFACGPNRLLQWIQKIEQVKNTSKLSINSYPVHGRVPDEAILLWHWTLDNQNWIILISSKHWLNGELQLSRWNQNYLYKLKIILIKVDKLRVNFNFIPRGQG